jgi:membrane dipeptidase
MSPKGFETPDKFPDLGAALLKRGYKPDEVTKILGGNWLRLFREVWVE